ncbi:hypothetical protein HOLleu_29658 [Holothuria leucospilota]|uniref:SnoaL-like domain-containing protein n=1 Tax=Holothuria leucospilota TaxID=206669 RepID=A0A9Q1BP68_HOLLE|nr:hypothetical protein HOLleu_29658 [Holothuria leucospilota]
MSSLKEEIEAADRKFMDRFGAGDFTGLSNLYTEDCKVMPTGSPTLNGRAATAKLFQSVYDAGSKKVKLVEEEVGSAGGDVIYSRGLYTFYLEDGKEADTGKVCCSLETCKWRTASLH